MEKSISKLEKLGLSLKSQKELEVILVASLELSEEEKNLPILKDIGEWKAPELLQISLYPEKGKLMLARLNRIDTKEQIENYRKKLLRAYGLKKPLWSAQGKTSKDKTGNTYTSRTYLYEEDDLFILLRDSSVKASEENLAKGRNHEIEILFYNKKNPGLSSKKILKQLERED